MQDLPRPVFDEDGTTHVPGFDLPPSAFSSAEARAAQAFRAKIPGRAPEPGQDITAIRAELEAMLAPQVAGMLEAYPVDIIDETIASVPVKIFTPKDRPFDEERVLIILHGGAFAMGWPSCTMLESPPVEVLGGYKVVSVNYRMAPEA